MIEINEGKIVASLTEEQLKKVEETESEVAHIATLYMHLDVQLENLKMQKRQLHQQSLQAGSAIKPIFEEIAKEKKVDLNKYAPGIEKNEDKFVVVFNKRKVPLNPNQEVPPKQ